MIKRKLCTVISGVALLTMVGCNYDDQGMTNRDHNQFGTLENRNVQNDNRNIFTNDRDQNDRGIFNTRDTNRNRNNNGNWTDLGGNNSPLTDISADKTETPSNKYPHTKAVQIQEAKFKYVKLDKNQLQELQNKLTNLKPGQQAVPNQGQQQAAPAPAPQQPAEQQQAAPTPAPQQPAEQQAPQQEAKAPEQSQAAEGISQFEQQVIDLTNAERRKNGLSNLQADTQLSGVAREKSNDMQKNNYFSHTSPTYGSPFDMMRDFNVTYKTAGENIAQGQQTPEQVVQAWMNSEGHRKNILSKDFTHIGVGYQQSGHHWTQMFIGK
ncbi:CAP domain-containing protein [Bacillus sp. PS06]|uniref:CAP domain-containing protein n=1 Tax=Bacillus sp. PS06 TaxID=2764176 RepID=UPI001CD8E888|nr:CAP domain-containing protein [Bacillus sp. PS06]